MKALRIALRIASFGLILASLETGLLADETIPRRSVLTSALSSATEITSIFQNSGVSQIHSLRSSAICKDLGACVEVTFYDAPDLIGSRPPGADSVESASGQKTTDFSSQQFEFQRVLESKWGDCPRSKTQKLFAKVVNEPPTDCLVKIFKEKGLLDWQTQVQADMAALESDFSDLSSGKIDASQFSSRTLNRPKALSRLPGFLIQARKNGNAPAVQALEDVIPKALLLTLDAVVPIASSANPTYPYFDNLVPDHSLLSVDKLYQALSTMTPSQWPGVTDLSPDLRTSLGGIYDQKATGGRWKVKGFYEQESNQVAIDLSNDFYENVFDYYHELWHVAWAHSSEAKKQTDAILRILRSPDADTSLLRQTILTALSTNEFLAIDQQIRLFHALGLDTEDWGGTDIASSRAWHDSYIGSEANDLLMLQRDDRGEDVFNRTLEKGGPSWGAAADLYHAIHNTASKSKYRRLEGKIRGELDSKYWQQQMATHAKLFELLYFGQKIGLSNEIQHVDPATLLQSPVTPYTPELSCSEAQKIENALGQDWLFGFPFNFKLSDPEQCPNRIPKPFLPSTEGSHAHIMITAQNPAVQIRLANPNSASSATEVQSRGTEILSAVPITQPSAQPSLVPIGNINTFPSLEGPAAD